MSNVTVSSSAQMPLWQSAAPLQGHASVLHVGKEDASESGDPSRVTCPSTPIDPSTAADPEVHASVSLLQDIPGGQPTTVHA
jgi:hypothetical protein